MYNQSSCSAAQLPSSRTSKWQGLSISLIAGDESIAFLPGSFGLMMFNGHNGVSAAIFCNYYWKHKRVENPLDEPQLRKFNKNWTAMVRSDKVCQEFRERVIQ